MILIIDTIERFEIKIGFFKAGNLKLEKFETKNQSADLLPILERELKKENKELKDIEAILVNQGPGSFTGVRVGVTSANALAWSLDIPVYGYENGNLDSTLAKIKKPLDKNFLKPVLPYYN